MDETCSIVHEYAVLYSYRILQKDKKWSDGKLRFYDFNNKMELLNMDDNIVESDFFPFSKKNPVISGFFAEGNQFKLPNNRALVEITDFLSIYTRDVSKLFKKNRLPSPKEITREPTKPEPPLAAAGIHLSLLQPKRRIVGLSRTVKREPGVETPVHQEISPERLKAAERRVSGPLRPNTRPTRANTGSGQSLGPVPAETDRIRALLSHSFRYPASRITPRSSSHFRWLRPGETATDFDPQIKLEKFSGGQKLDDADIIHDLSEFEDDEAFLELLRQLKKSRLSGGPGDF